MLHRLKEGGTYFKERAIIHLKFQKFVILYFKNKKHLTLHYMVLFIPELLVSYFSYFQVRTFVL